MSLKVFDLARALPPNTVVLIDPKHSQKLLEKAKKELRQDVERRTVDFSQLPYLSSPEADRPQNDPRQPHHSEPC